MTTVPLRYKVARWAICIVALCFVYFFLTGVMSTADTQGFPSTREGVAGAFTGVLVSVVAFAIALKMLPILRKRHFLLFPMFLTAFGVIIGCGAIGESVGLAPFRDLKDKYASRNWRSFPVAAEVTPFVRGKIFTIFERHVALMYPPGTMWPRSPEEVGTIVYIDRCRQEVVGKYYRKNDVDHKRLIPALQWACHVAFVDRGTDTLVGEQTLRGAAPEKSVALNESATSNGGPPVREEDIKEYLAGLPRR
jgi:hypothetical protein